MNEARNMKRRAPNCPAAGSPSSSVHENRAGLRSRRMNVLSLGQRMISRELALRLVEIWLGTPFEGGRHRARLRKIEGT